jgi:hypothetical protein
VLGSRVGIKGCRRGIILVEVSSER